MANIDSKRLNKQPQMQHVYGNLAVMRERVTVPVGSAAADVVRFMRLRKGTRILDFFARWDGGNSAVTTGSFGLGAVEGGASTYADADYFLLSTTDLNAANARAAWNNTAVYSIELDDDYYVQAVLAGATTAGAAMDVEVTVYYEFVGNL